MKICALILAHYNKEVFRRLVERLVDHDIDCYIHIDLKQPLYEYRAISPSCVQFIEPRIDIRWGGFSMVEATLSLARIALRDPAYTHFIHISGDSYPVLPMQQVRNYIGRNIDHMSGWEVQPDFSDESYTRITRVHLCDYAVGEFTNRFGYQSRYVTPELIRAFPEIERVHAMKQNNVFPWKLAKGSQWWSLRRSSLEACLEGLYGNEIFIDWFRYSCIPDESFFQSAMLNFVKDFQFTDAPMFTLWDRVPRPYKFCSLADIELLGDPRKPFARKFDPSSLDLLLAINSRLVEEK